MVRRVRRVRRVRSWGPGRREAAPPVGCGAPSRSLLLGGLALVLLAVAAVVVAYVRTPIPDPNDAVFAETTTLYYADGTTELGTFAEQDRTIVASEEIPDTIRQAVVAAEDRTFYDNPGVSPTGIARAAWGIVTREPAGGGSTITQQYVKNYFLTSDQTFQRKFTEILIVAQGRAGAEQGPDPHRLPQHRVLRPGHLRRAGRGPGLLRRGRRRRSRWSRPRCWPACCRRRTATTPPRTPRPRRSASTTWRDGLVVTGVAGPGRRRTRSCSRRPWSRRRSRSTPAPAATCSRPRARSSPTSATTTRTSTPAGCKVVTTYDPAVQDAVEAGVAEQMPHPRGHRRGAAEPGPAGRRGEHRPGHRRGAGHVRRRRPHPAPERRHQGHRPGRVDVQAVHAGRRAGGGGVAGRDASTATPGASSRATSRPVRNFGGTDYGTVDLVDATANSVNTAYVELNSQIGPAATREVAVRAGLPDTTAGLDDFLSNVLGAASPRPIDMAQVMPPTPPRACAASGTWWPRCASPTARSPTSRTSRGRRCSPPTSWPTPPTP